MASLISALRMWIAMVAILIICVSAGAAQGNLTDTDFKFSVVMNSKFSRTKKDSYRVRSLNGDVFVERPDKGCTTKADVVQETDRSLSLKVKFDNGACGDGFITIYHRERNQWRMSWAVQKGGTTTYSAELTYDHDPEAVRVANPTKTFSDGVLGLTLAEGPLRQGIGPTSLVVSVESGGVSDQAGIQVGDLILTARIAGPPDSHIRHIKEWLEIDRPVNVLIEQPDGSRHNRRIMPPPKEVNKVLVTDVSAINRIFSGDGKSFLRDRSALQQLIELGEALGIDQDEISQAIADGRLNPSLSDLIRAYLELDTTTCSDLAKRIRAREKVGSPLYNRANDCEWIALNVDEVRFNAWNARFGPRPAELQTMRIDPTVIAYFNANDVLGKRFHQLRCDFTTALSEVATILVDCAGARPTKKRNLVYAQASDARRDDVFGSADDPTSYRIRLISDGAFETLETLAIEDMKSRRPPAEHLVSYIGAYRPNGPEPRYTPLIASYILARVYQYGPCGDRLVRLTKSVEDRRKLGTLSGYTIRDDDFSYSLDVNVPAAFAPTVEKMAHLPMPGEPGWGRIRAGLGEVLRGLSCDSEERRRLEANMLAYIDKNPPEFRR